MKIAASACGLLVTALLATTSAAAEERGEGSEFGVDLIYQLGQDIDFNGGSSASLDDDFGIVATFGYRFSSHLEIQAALDWQDTDYDVNLVTDPGGATVRGSGSLQAITPRVSVQYDFTPGGLSPFVSAGIGWSFIDTNIPQGRPENVCWWDPWWGYVCGTVQDSKSVDGFEYQLGAGLRWDFSPGYTLRFAYEKHWLDLDEADGAPGLDQFKLGIAFRY